MEALELGTTEEINKVLSEVDFRIHMKIIILKDIFYPETYIFSENVTTKQVIQTILAEFLKKFPPEKYPDKQKFYDTLKLASIVEAEVPDAVDKPKVAGIFLKKARNWNEIRVRCYFKI